MARVFAVPAHKRAGYPITLKKGGVDPAEWKTVQWSFGDRSGVVRGRSGIIRGSFGDRSEIVRPSFVDCSILFLKSFFRFPVLYWAFVLNLRLSFLIKRFLIKEGGCMLIIM